MDDEIKALTELAADVVDRARKGGADVAEAVARSSNNLSVEVRLGEPELVQEAGSRGLSMRVIKERRVAVTSTSDLTPRGLDRFVKDALELVDISQEDPFAGPADPDLIAKGGWPELDLYDPACGEVTAAQALELSKRGEDAARAADARIINSDGASFARGASAFAMVLSGGFRGGYAGSYAQLVVTPVAEDEGGKKQRGFHYTARRHLSELDSPESVGQEATRRTLRKLGARKVPTCEAAVIFDPDVARAILGTLASSVMSTSIWRKSSYLVGREGTRVASDLVTIVDDPLIPRGSGSRPFDGEGLLARRNVVVEGGILKTYLCDSYGARKLGRASTASAARGGGVGPSTTQLHPPALGDQGRRHPRLHQARPLRHGDEGLRLQRHHRRLLQGRVGLLDRGRQARPPRQRGHHLAQHRPALAAHRRRRRRSRSAHLDRLAHAARLGDDHRRELIRSVILESQNERGRAWLSSISARRPSSLFSQPPR